MSLATTTSDLRTFSLKGTPLLSAGNSMTTLGITDNLWLHLKVYSSGGENGLHNHSDEDHAFLVLQGQATFYDDEGQETVLGKYEGIAIPKGTNYRFASSKDENLVLLRVGGGQRTEFESGGSPDYPAPMNSRRMPNGQAFPGESPENKTGSMKPVTIPGAFFGT